MGGVPLALAPWRGKSLIGPPLQPTHANAAADERQSAGHGREKGTAYSRKNAASTQATLTRHYVGTVPTT